MAHELLAASVTVAGAAFLLAGFVKGVIGLGLPTVAIGLLGLVMTPPQAAALLVVPSLATNLWQLAAGPGLVPLLRRFRMLLIGLCAGTWGGGALLHGVSHARAGIWLGMALIAYALLGLSAKQFRVSLQHERWLSPLIGAATGVVAASTGVFVMPLVPFLQALGLAKDELVQALGLSFTVSTVALAMLLTYQGTFQLSVAGASLMALVPAAAGMGAGQWVRERVRASTFRLCFFAGLLLLGGHLALRPLF
jgi:uncharacterized protein